MLELNTLDALATLWLILCWWGYSVFARKRARKAFCIASVLHKYRQQWMLRMLCRENRIADASLLSNLERNASFLASTAILIIAGLMTALASTEKVHALISSLPFSHPNLSAHQVQFKILVLLLINVYAFFTFTWSMRQYGFCAVLLGAAPIYEEHAEPSEESKNYARQTAKVIDQAGHSYNYGLRAFYFSLAVLSWPLNTWVFICSVALVVAVLFGREFHSKTLKSMIHAESLSLKDLRSRATK